MGSHVNTTTSGASEYGRRLLVDVVDQVAASDPDRPFIIAPLSNNPEHGWAPFTYRDFAHAINSAAHDVARIVKATSTEAFPTLAYVGPNDIRYPVIMLACVKAGCKALFVSPRNSTEGQVNLFEKTSCTHLWYAGSYAQRIQPWVEKRPMATQVVPPIETWTAQVSRRFPYARSFEEARLEPLVVLHTSGSTGLPKPIVMRHGSLALGDAFRSLTDSQGSEFIFRAWQRRATNMFSPMPLFHAAGIIGSVALFGIYYGTPVTIGMPDEPLASETVPACLVHSGADSAFLPPSILEGLSHDEASIMALKKLSYVGFAGGNLPRAAGERLIKNGVQLSNLISSTEILPYPLFWQPNPHVWQYFHLSSKAIGAVWSCVDEKELIYELLVRRRDTSPPDQAAFYTFPDLREWSTGDLFRAHPSLPDFWEYSGRADDVIVFSNGEKFNPVATEDGVVGHHAVKGALVVGQDRFQAALILEPFRHPADEAERERLIDAVWPQIELANRDAPGQGRILRQFVSIADPSIPFCRAGKGTVQRGLTLKAYKEHIDALYERAERADAKPSHSLDIANPSALTRSILELVKESCQVPAMGQDTDFFLAGIDSVGMLDLVKRLKAGARMAGVAMDSLTSRFIYSNSTPRRLAERLFSLVNNNAEIDADTSQTDVETLKKLIDKYTDCIPTAKASKPGPADHGQTIILTGSTGSLGSYLLDRLCFSARVAKVITLNRDQDGGGSRQVSVNEARGLTLDFSKVEFVQADLSLPRLGLTAEKYDELLAGADRVIHNAWPVHFNIGIDSFEPSISGVRHLVDFSNAAAKRVPIVFLSSISTVASWNQNILVPETVLEDLSLADMGYGRSKLAGSRILDAAASRCAVPTASIRIGQIAGPRSRSGMWKKQEAIPTLIASSLQLGLLPRSIGSSGQIDWLPIEDVASMVLDISGVSLHRDVGDINGYFHCVNPTKTTWHDAAQTLLDHYGDRLRPVPLQDWVNALERSAEAGVDANANPGIKLLDTFRGMLQSQREGRSAVVLDMSRTVGCSPAVAQTGPISAEMLKRWCEQWAF